MMIRRILAMVLLCCTGCLTLPPNGTDPVPVQPAAMVQPLTPVTPDQVTRGNALRVVESLWQELERASEE